MTRLAAADPKAVHVAEEWQHERPLISCRFDPTGRFVFACSEDFTIQRWELASKNKVALTGHGSWPRDIAFTPSGDMAVSCGYDESLIWWETAAPQPTPVRTVKAHEGWVDAVAISPDGQLIASGGRDRVVRLWRVADGSLVREMPGHEKHIYSAAFHPAGEFLLTGDLAGKVHQWEVATGKLVRTFDATALWSYNAGQGVDYGGVRGIAFSPDGQQVAFSGLHNASNPLGAVNEPLVLRFSWEKAEKLRSHVAPEVKGVAWRVCFHPEGFLMAASGGSGGGWLLFWNGDADPAFHKFQLPNTARGMDLHPDGVHVATAHYDRKLRISRLAPKPSS